MGTTASTTFAYCKRWYKDKITNSNKDNKQTQSDR